MRASWIFTRSDVIANVGVVLAGLLVLVTNSRWPDLIVGAAIYFWRPWGLVVGVLGGVLGLLFHGTTLPLALASPNSFYDFSGAVLGTLGSLFILVGSVGGLVQH